MSHTDYRILIDRGRKSGLKTSELYNALTGHPPTTNDFVNGHVDSNGFVPTLDQCGHSIFRPRENTENH
jgi:hypothetical protein